VGRLKKLPFEPIAPPFEVRVIGEAGPGDSLPAMHHIARGGSLPECLMRAFVTVLHRVEIVAQGDRPGPARTVIIRMEVTTWTP
jgi:hypothetical protein